MKPGGNADGNTAFAKDGQAVAGHADHNQNQKIELFENSQSALLGPPKLSGLSTYEYAVDGLLRYHCAEMKPEHVDVQSVERYERIFHQEVGFGFGSKNGMNSAEGAKADDWKTQTAGGSSINRKNIQIETDKHIFSLAENDSLNRGQKSSIHPQFPLNKGRTGGTAENTANAAEVKQGLHQAYPS